MAQKKKLSNSMKCRIAGKQFYHCANIPNSGLPWLQDYNCPLWQIDEDHKGCFDESGYSISPIYNFDSSGAINEDQYHALCHNCNIVKSLRRSVNQNH